MEKVVSDFCERLSREHAPAFLLLGQNHLRMGTKSDVLLDAIIEKYGEVGHSDTFGYNRIFETSVGENAGAARAWISDRTNLLVPPAWLESIAEFAWSGVYTSAFDNLLNRVFRSEWREVQPITSPDLQPLDPRNRTNLHISYLFGSIERGESNHASPIDEFEFTIRDPIVSSLLQRLPESITPFGTLVIEAYDPKSDWLTPQKLIPILMALEKGQAFLFSTKIESITNGMLKRAISEGKLQVFENSLAAVLLQGMDLGIVPSGKKVHISSKSRIIELGSDEVVVDEQLWGHISRFGTILDINLPGPKKTYSPEKRYSEFRSFLAESGVQPIWNAFAQGLPFERDCEADLLKEVRVRLHGQVFNSEPVILHGQAGSGKTITLASVALKIHEERKYPVVFIARRSQKFNYADLDNFCQWAEEAGFSATVVVWDGMQELEQYNLLHKYLLGRGRKFVLIASSYKVDEDDSLGNKLVLSPSLLSSAEIPRFKLHISSFESTLGASLDVFLKDGDSSFLVALYRLLPESRGQVRKGLNLEAGAAAALIRNKSELIKPEAQETILSIALQKAGMLTERKILPDEPSLVAGEWIHAEQELIGLILVPGQFGLQVPIEILLRSISRSAVTNFHAVVEGIDLFRWSEDSLDNITLGVRHALEAKIIAQSRLGGPHAEIEYAIKLISNIRQNLTRRDSPEVQFAADLIHNLGPKGPEKKLYAPYYLDLARALAGTRQNNGVQSHRLILQESSLLREAIVLNLIPESDLSGRLLLLEQAELVLSEAVKDIDFSKKTARLNGMLLNELASIYGTRAREYIRAEEPVGLVLEEFYKAKKIAMNARGLMPEDFFPIDVIAWCTKDVLKYARLDERERLEIITSIFNVFTLCDGDEIGTRDKVMLERRRVEFADLLGDEVLKKESLEALAKLGSTAGYYLQAAAIAGGLPSSDTLLDDQVLSKYEAAASYLSDNYELIQADGRCLYLYLRYWWSSASKLSFFPAERTAVPFSNVQWTKALQIIEGLIAVGEEYSSPSLLYLQAICKWQLGYHDIALELWRELQRLSDRVTGRRRVLKTYLSSDASGRPIKYNGTVLWVSADGSKGEIFVEGIRQKVAFFPRDFKIDEIYKDEKVSDFHIAFNYIAPTADPVYHYSSNSGVKK